MRLISKVELATIAGVSKPSISLACRKAFPAALIDGRVDFDHADVQKYLSGKAGVATRVANRLLGPPPKTTAPRPSMADLVAADRDSVAPAEEIDAGTNNDRGVSGSAVIEEASEARADTTTQRPRLVHRSPDPRRQPRADLGDGEILRYLDMTVRELLREHGTFEGFDDFLNASKRMRDIEQKDLAIAERKKQLISRDLVRTHVFGYLDSTHRKILTDTVATIARTCEAEVKAGSNVETLEKLVRELLTQQLEPARVAISKRLRDTEGA